MRDEVFDTKSMAIASSISFFQRCSASRCCGASRCCSASRCRRIQVRLLRISLDLDRLALGGVPSRTRYPAVLVIQLAHSREITLGDTAPAEQNAKEKTFQPRQTRKTKVGLWCCVLHSRKETSASGTAFCPHVKERRGLPPLHVDVLMAVLHRNRRPHPTQICAAQGACRL